MHDRARQAGDMDDRDLGRPDRRDPARQPRPDRTENDAVPDAAGDAATENSFCVHSGFLWVDPFSRGRAHSDRFEGLGLFVRPCPNPAQSVAFSHANFPKKFPLGAAARLLLQ